MSLLTYDKFIVMILAVAGMYMHLHTFCSCTMLKILNKPEHPILFCFEAENSMYYIKLERECFITFPNTEKS